MSHDIRRYIRLVENTQRSDEVYSHENGYLLRYLKNHEFDPHAHWYEVCEWIDNNDWFEDIVSAIHKDSPDQSIETIDDLHDHDPDYFYLLPPEAQEECAKEVVDDLMQNNPVDAPTWAHMSVSSKDQLLPRAAWLIHFTNDPWGIARSGFEIGTPDMCRLGLTRWVKDSAKQGGYNFAFEANSRDARRAASKKTYGRNAVMFRNSGVQAYHYGDEEHQVIFNGADVYPRDIIVLTSSDGDWKVRGHRDTRRGDDVLYVGEFEKCVAWVERNFIQYRHYLTRR